MDKNTIDAIIKLIDEKLKTHKEFSQQGYQSQRTVTAISILSNLKKQIQEVFYKHE